MALLAGIAGYAADQTTLSNSPPMQTARKFQFKGNHAQTVNYLLYLPKGYTEQGANRWPLLLFLHGAGERGDDIWLVAKHGPPKNVPKDSDFPFIVVSPQCRDGESWSREMLLDLLDEITAQCAVDTRRIYLTGLSMGGYGTWDLALSHPEKFAAIVPICGGGELIDVLLLTGKKEAAVKTLGIWAFHGAKDPVVPVSESQRMVEALKQRGVQDIKLTIYPEALHDSWTETYNNPEVYKWLLQHQRAPEK
jgi:predicted peptidase